MIRDLSETLRALLDDPALAADFPDLAAAQIAFDRPAEGFSPGQTTVDLFLYDIRENMELRSNEPLHTRTNGDVVIRRAPTRVACSYLLTAWPVGGAEPPLQEHRLLSQALEVLLRYPRIPSAFLQGRLAGQEPPLPMLTAQTEGVRDPAEFWAAIGSKLRASIHLTATIALDVLPPTTAPEVIASRIDLGRRAAPDEEELAAAAGLARYRIGGRITDAGGHPVAGARVRIPKLGLAGLTDEEGRYQLGAMAAGTHAVRVEKGSTVRNVTVVVPPGAAGAYDVQL